MVQRLFGLDRAPFDFRHYEREETGYGIVLMDPRLGIAIGLHANTANRGEALGDVAPAHAYAPISMHIRYRQSRRRWRAKRLTQSWGGLPAGSVPLAGGGRMAVERPRTAGYVPVGAPLGRLARVR